MIIFSNGYRLDFCCASGALAFNGCGWWWERPLLWMGLLNPHKFTVVAKTVTMEPVKGNLSLWHPWTCVRPLKNGSFVNAVGLTNPGIYYWIARHYCAAKVRGYNIAASIEPHTADEANTMGHLLEVLDLPYIEVNISCPNTSEINDAQEILEAVSISSKKPIVAKLSHSQCMDKDFATSIAKSSGVEAIHAINTVPYQDIFPNGTSPIKKTTGRDGGVSGKLIAGKALEAVFNLRKHGIDLPIIGGGGISSLQDINRIKDAGANAFSIGSLFLSNPIKPNRLISEYRLKRSRLEKMENE